MCGQIYNHNNIANQEKKVTELTIYCICSLCSEECFEILDSASTGFQLKIEEAMHILWEKPSLNKLCYLPIYLNRLCYFIFYFHFILFRALILNHSYFHHAQSNYLLLIFYSGILFRTKLTMDDVSSETYLQC